MENARSGFDLESGCFWIEIDSPPEIETEFLTENGCRFSIFPDDEYEGSVHVEIKPDYVWEKEDIWELIAELLISVGEMDKEGNIISSNTLSKDIDELRSTFEGIIESSISKDISNYLNWVGKNTRDIIEEIEAKNYEPLAALGSKVKFLHKGRLWTGVIECIHPGDSSDEYVIVSSGIRFHKNENELVV